MPELGVTPAEASSAAYGTYGCRPVFDRDHKYRVDPAVLVTSTMSSEFCWNKVSHKASLPGPGQGYDHPTFRSRDVRLGP